MSVHAWEISACGLLAGALRDDGYTVVVTSCGSLFATADGSDRFYAVTPRSDGLRVMVSGLAGVRPATVAEGCSEASAAREILAHDKGC